MSIHREPDASHALFPVDESVRRTMAASQPKPAAHTAVEVLPGSVPVTMPDLPPTFTITTEQQLKALGDATRTRILSIIQNQPATAKQIADNLGVTPGTIGHHPQLLQDPGPAHA